MSALQNTQQSLQANTDANSLTIRELSTAQQSDWIERIFKRLSAIYGQEFSYKWENTDPGALKREWAEALGGFHAADIAAALQSCRSQPKAPNLPEFASLCRQNMNTHQKPAMAPLSSEDKAAAAKVAELVTKSLSAKEANTKGYLVNDVLVTIYKQWAVDLVKREAGGESLQMVNKESWREVLDYPKDYGAKKALSDVLASEQSRRAA